MANSLSRAMADLERSKGVVENDNLEAAARCAYLAAALMARAAVMTAESKRAKRVAATLEMEPTPSGGWRIAS